MMRDSQPESTPHLALFDLYVGGHHGEHFQHLLAYWQDRGLPGRLDIVAPPAMLDVHTELAARLEEAPENVQFIPIEDPLDFDTGGTLGLIRADLTHGRVLRRYVEQHRPDHCLISFFDHLQVSLATDLRFDYPVRFSGTYFRPSFHYPDLSGERPSASEWVQNLRKKVVLRAALRNPHFDTLCCLDPFVVPYAQRLAPGAKAVPLPDGIERLVATATAAETRAQLDVEEGRRLLLLFGSLTRRKGIFKVLDAIRTLPDDLDARYCLVLAGRVHDVDRAALLQDIEALRQRRGMQIILRDAFIDYEEMRNLFEAADVALVPYQRHLGSSGVLVRAAAAAVPVLGPDYGMMGALIPARRLGLAVDTTDTSALADGLRTCLTQPLDALFEATETERFAAENTADHYAETIFRQLLGDAWPSS